MASEDFNVWEGIYDSFEEAPGEGQGFASERWVEAERERLQDRIEQLSDGSGIPPDPWYPGSLLPVVLAMLGRERSDFVVLDFGGGGGLTWLDVRAGLADYDLPEYHIVDLEPVCEMGVDVFEDDPRVQFHTEIPMDVRPDVVHLASSIQYVEDWRGLLETLTAHRPELLVFADLMAGDVPTFVTVQNDYESKTPMRFYNLEDFLDHLASLGYEPRYRAAYMGEILGEIQPNPQENFPPEYRLGRSGHLVLEDIEDPER